MPNYDFYCFACDVHTERNVPIAERESQECDTCGRPLKKQWSFNGSVWSPTRNGGHS